MKVDTQRHTLLPMNNTTESVQIRVHGVDGSIQTFTQRTDSLIRQTLDWLRPTFIFKQQRIEIPGEHSLTTFIATQVTRIDIVTEPRSSWNLPSELVQAVELSETAFRALAKSPEPPEVQKASPPLENTALVLIDIALTGGHHVFLAQETAVSQPSQTIESLSAFLATTSFAFLMRTGGVAVLNVANLVCFTVYPDLGQVSAEAWTLRQRNGTALECPQGQSALRGLGEQEAA